MLPNLKTLQNKKLLFISGTSVFIQGDQGQRGPPGETGPKGDRVSTKSVRILANHPVLLNLAWPVHCNHRGCLIFLISSALQGNQGSRGIPGSPGPKGDTVCPEL